MSQIMTKNAQKIQYALSQQGRQCKVIELPKSTRTAQEAALSIGCLVSQIVKSLIFKTQDTFKPILILVSGPNRVDEKIIENLIGEKILKADAEFTREVTGFAIGGIPPIGHKHIIDLIFIDEDLLKNDNVWAAAGIPNAVFNIKSQDLVFITNAKIISLSHV